MALRLCNAERAAVVTGSRQVTEAAGPKGRFFDRPAGDKKESERFSKSETKKKKGLFVPLDKKVSVPVKRPMR